MRPPQVRTPAIFATVDGSGIVRFPGSVARATHVAGRRTCSDGTSTLRKQGVGVPHGWDSQRNDRFLYCSMNSPNPANYSLLSDFPMPLYDK